MQLSIVLVTVALLSTSVHCLSDFAITPASNAAGEASTAIVSFKPTTSFNGSATAGLKVTIAGIALGSAATTNAPATSALGGNGSATAAPAPAASTAYAPPDIVVATTAHAAATTAHAAATTAHEAATTTHEAATTTHEAATTTHEAATTTHEAATTTHEAATTTHEEATTTHEEATTTHEEATTTHPEVTTSAPAPARRLLATSVCTVSVPSDGQCALSYSNSVLTIKLTAGTFLAGMNVKISITDFVNPPVGTVQNISVAAVSDVNNPASPVISFTTTVSFPTIVPAPLKPFLPKASTSKFEFAWLLVAFAALLSWM
jgi:hypothetical protein